MAGSLAPEPRRRSPSDTDKHTEVSSTVRRKPLPSSTKVINMKRLAILPGSVHHPTTRWDETQQQIIEESLKSPPLSRLIDYDMKEYGAVGPQSPFVFGDQLYPKMPYSEDKDVEAWRHDGDTVICIGKNVELRIDSTTIIKSRYGALIERLQELNDSDSADFTEAAPYSKVPIRYIVELPEPVRSDPTTYCVSVRNFFAALRNKPIAGEDLVSELDQLHWTAVDLLGAQNHRDKAARFVRKYVQRLKLDDCRYMRTNAIRLLSWCERTKWEKGWIESFAHCVGMMGNGIEDCDAFQELSERTRKLLYRSHRKQDHEIRAMEGIFAEFEIAGSATTVDLEHAGGLRAARLFQRFLKDYYARKFGSWPPAAEDTNGGHWLTRTIAQTLQEDFGGLYDLLVDDLVIQFMDGAIPYLLHINDDETLTPLEEAPHGSQFPLQKVISSWNFKCGFEPIPHPWPLLPKLRGTSPIHDPNGNKISLVTALREREIDPAEDQTDLRNAYIQGTHQENPLSQFAQAFLQHEATTRIKGVNTHNARLGRWLVIQCMLQLLSKLAVDIQGLWYTNGVPYFLNADIKQCPPWTGAKIPHTIRPSSCEDSWCWLYARGVEEFRRRNKIDGGGVGAAKSTEPRVPTPRYRVYWDEDGRWEMSPAERKNR